MNMTEDKKELVKMKAPFQDSAWKVLLPVGWDISPIWCLLDFIASNTSSIQMINVRMLTLLAYSAVAVLRNPLFNVAVMRSQLPSELLINSFAGNDEILLLPFWATEPE